VEADRGLGRDALVSYLANLFGNVEVLAVRPLKGGELRPDDPKGFGYPADRAWQARALVLAHPRWYSHLADSTHGLAAFA
jgi:hypothetical protein